MRRAALALFGAALACWAPAASATSVQEDAYQRSRLIVLTDIGNEPDDSQSLVRLLLYSNEIDIEGLVAATSRHLPKQVHPELIEERVTAYGQVVANLRIHDPHYPNESQLRRRIRSGSAVYGMTGVGKGKDTAASRLIIEVVDRPDARPVWIAVWGGAADLAQALWKVRATRSAAQLERFVSKLRVYSISDQDDAGPWARANFSGLFWVTSIHGASRYLLGTWYGIAGVLPGADTSLVSRAWLEQNVRGKGPLGAVYPRPTYIMEGDTPSFLNLIPNGLGSPERPDWGGWGGRYEKLADGLGLWTTTLDGVIGSDGKFYLTPQASVWRWRRAFQADFAARMTWTITPDLKSANHPPIVFLNGTADIRPLEIAGCPGVPIRLSATGSTDPDGDGLSFKWWWYSEASGLFAPMVKFSSGTGSETAVTVNGTVRIDQFTAPTSYKLHVILEATETRTPALTRYRRAIITIPGVAIGAAAGTCAIRPVPLPH